MCEANPILRGGRRARGENVGDGSATLFFSCQLQFRVTGLHPRQVSLLTKQRSILCKPRASAPSENSICRRQGDSQTTGHVRKEGEEVGNTRRKRRERSKLCCQIDLTTFSFFLFKIQYEGFQMQH